MINGKNQRQPYKPPNIECWQLVYSTHKTGQNTQIIYLFILIKLQNVFWMAIESCLHAEVPAVVKIILRANGHDNANNIQEINHMRIDEIEAHVNRTCSWPHYVRNITDKIEDSYKKQQIFQFSDQHRTLLLQLAAIAKSKMFKAQYDMYIKKGTTNVQLLKNEMNTSEIGIEGLINEPSHSTVQQLKKLLCEKIGNVIGNKGGFTWTVSVLFC